jgi:hypothetical protein
MSLQEDKLSFTESLKDFFAVMKYFFLAIFLSILILASYVGLIKAILWMGS